MKLLDVFQPREHVAVPQNENENTGIYFMKASLVLFIIYFIYNLFYENHQNENTGIYFMKASLVLVFE